MKPRSILSFFALAAAAFASADHNWHLDSFYDYAITANVGTATLRDVEEAMEGGFVDDPYSGFGVSSSFAGGNVGQGHLSLDTYDFFGKAASRPFVRESLLFGVMQGLPQDVLDGNADQKHLVLFMNPTAAANVANVAFGDVFGTSAQGPTVYTEETLIDATEKVHTDLSDAAKRPYYDILDTFRYSIARRANVGVGGTQDTIWFTPQSGFRTVIFSNGATIGTGTNTTVTTLTPVPEPASLAALGIGAAAFLRRRKR